MGNEKQYAAGEDDNSNYK